MSIKSGLQLQVGEIGCILTVLYTILILPILLLYRSMEMLHTADTAQEEGRGRAKLKYPPEYEEGWLDRLL